MRIGLLSGKYDSTKQKAVLLNGDRYLNFKSYTATMRLELLLTGKLIFTDAQFFDGLYFHWLSEDSDEFESFKKLLYNYDSSNESYEPAPYSISVKCRKDNKDETAIYMYSKQFWFSSIEVDELAKEVYEIGRDFEEKYYKEFIYPIDEEVRKNKCLPVEEKQNTLDEYLTKIEEKLHNTASVEEWKRYAERLRKVYDIPIDIWGYYSEETRKHESDYLISDVLVQNYPDEKPCYESMTELIQKNEVLMNDDSRIKIHSKRVLSELNNNFGNRSKLVNALDALDKLNEQINSSNKDAADIVSGNIKDFRQLMNDRYNKALAIQHGSAFVDLCDYQKVFTIVKDRKIINKTVDIDKELFSYLAEMTWSQFVSILNSNADDELKRTYSQWICAYNEGLGVENALKKYLDCINKKFCKELKKIEKPSNDIKPWNRYGTCNYKNSIDDGLINRVGSTDDYTGIPYYFVGGGSFEGSHKGNELCILCENIKVNDDSEGTIFRIRFKGYSNTKLDNDYDILLAPVFNSINGMKPCVVRMEKELGPLELYEQLMKDRPEEFKNKGTIKIIKNVNTIKRYMKDKKTKLGVVYKSKFNMMVVDLVKDYENRIFQYERIIPTVKKGAVVVLPIYEDQVVLLKQYRHALRDYQYSIPRGYGEEGVSAEENVKKEIAEELGADAYDVKYLGTCVADSGLSGNKVSIYMCNIKNYNIRSGYEGIKEAVCVKIQDLPLWIRDGKINDGFTLSALCYYNNGH